MYIPFEHQKQSLLRHVNLEEIYEKLLSGEFCIKAYPKDTIIHRKGECIKALEIVIMGEILLNPWSQKDSTKSAHLHDMINVKEVFIDHSTYAFDVVANEDSLLLSITRSTLLLLFQTNTSLFTEYSKL